MARLSRKKGKKRDPKNFEIQANKNFKYTCISSCYNLQSQECSNIHLTKQKSQVLIIFSEKVRQFFPKKWEHLYISNRSSWSKFYNSRRWCLPDVYRTDALKLLSPETDCEVSCPSTQHPPEKTPPPPETIAPIGRMSSYTWKEKKQFIRTNT